MGKRLSFKKGRKGGGSRERKKERGKKAALNDNKKTKNKTRFYVKFLSPFLNC